MYVQQYVLVLQRNKCCLGNASTRLLLIAVADVAVNNINVLYCH